MKTDLSIVVRVDRILTSRQRPSDEWINATSVLTLENGHFTSPPDLGLSTSDSIRVEMSGARVLQIVAVAHVYVRAGAAGPVYYTVFGPNRITLTGLPVAIDLPTPGEQCRALTGELRHRVGIGRFRVASVADPQGTTLAPGLERREFALRI